MVAGKRIRNPRIVDVSKKFDAIEIGDQLEMPANRGSVVYGSIDTRDPERPIRVAIVTHIWHDPVDDKEYVGLAYIRRGGSYGRPTEKRTITGLARCGWRKAEIDWLARIEAEEGTDNVVSLWKRHQP